MKRIVTMAAACLALTGCNSAKRGAEAAVRRDLKDPGSAQLAPSTITRRQDGAA